MLTVDDYGRIRRAHRDGMGIREIARRFHHSRQKVRQILRGEPQPRPYAKRSRQQAPKLGPFKARILQILKQDESSPPKQRHTAMRIFERLRDEDSDDAGDEGRYQGAYDSVRRFVKQHRESKRETFIPLDHDPGQRVEADFGEIVVDFPDGRRKVNVLILVWSHSNAPFAIAFPTQRTEAILEGMAQAFEFFGCVPKEVWWDNPRTVADAVLKGRERKVNSRYAALASHFAFEPLFCLPASGNEKPVVENRVKTLERKWSTPIPQMQDMAELNVYLRECCVRDRDRNSSGKTEAIGVRFEQDRAASAGLPKHRFDTSLRRDARVDKYQFARFDNVSYSVPRHCAFQSVTVKAYVDRVEIVHQNAVVATHERSYQTGDQVLDPLHYLTTLERRPAALDHSNVYRKWKLPAVFLRLRERLEDRHGARAGVRQYVRVLQLLASHPMQRVQSAVEQLRGPEGADADRIIRRVEGSAERSRKSSGDPLETSPAKSSLQDEGIRDEVLSVQVPTPGLSHFDQFLSTSIQGSDDDDHEEENQPRDHLGKRSSSEAAHHNSGHEESSEERCDHLLLKSNLKQLRLPTMKAEFEQLAREAVGSNQTFEQYLLRLTELEVSARASNTLNSRIKQAQFPVQKDLDSYDFSALPSVNKQKVLELARGDWITQHANVCLIGQPGTGKTHLSIALGLAACREGRRTKFFTAASLVNQLEEAQKKFGLDQLLKRLDKIDLLIVDELGYLSFSRSGAELLFQVFADRYERRSLLITSNLSFSDWSQIFQGERMTAALLDRLTHHCHIFEMNGESFRFKESMKDKKKPGTKA